VAFWRGGGTEKRGNPTKGQTQNKFKGKMITKSMKAI
jgi:hypothetical protein